MTIRQPELTREAIAHREVGHTNVRPGTARFLLAAFLLFICAVPLFEVAASRGDRDSVRPWDHLLGIPSQVYTTEVEQAPRWRHVVAVNRIVISGLHAFEEALEDTSRVGQLLRPPAQLVMSERLGAGNELTYIGREGWLFYPPDVEYVTGAGFLDEAARGRRALTTDEWKTLPHSDPRPAIVGFKQMLEAKGITLIVMPTPLKPAIHPERLSARAATARLPIQNPSYERFIADLRAAGVLVFDPANVMLEALRPTSATQYLATDTHWRPEVMEMVADRLADFLGANVQLRPRNTAYRTQSVEMTATGDLAVMLDLPGAQTWLEPDSVTVRRVLDASGAPWRPSRQAEVLLLGDSFTNIYSLASMRWGDAAGFAEHLSRALRRPIDRIVQNDAGAYATREQLHGSPDRLAGKRVVIYQFATRELSFGDWRVFDGAQEQEGTDAR